jgi:hypothetical protein
MQRSRVRLHAGILCGARHRRKRMPSHTGRVGSTQALFAT